MSGDTIGLKVTNCKSVASCIPIIRKYNKKSMGEIKAAIQDGGYVLRYDYDDDAGVKKLIACYKELTKAQIGAQLYEMDDEPTTLEFMQNLNSTYDDISDEVDEEMNR